jgi:hypothetical protein
VEMDGESCRGVLVRFSLKPLFLIHSYDLS